MRPRVASMAEPEIERHDLTIETDFLGGEYNALCSCGWMGSPKANSELALFEHKNHLLRPSFACPWCGEPMVGGAGPDGFCRNGHEWWDDA
jgi:hypothetical protein